VIAPLVYEKHTFIHLGISFHVMMKFISRLLSRCISALTLKDEAAEKVGKQ